MIKTFRGLLADGGQDRIRLSTIKGKVGYRITKFQTMQETPGITSVEHIVKIYKTSQSTIDGIVNFSDSDLLAAAYESEDSSTNYTGYRTVIFDNEIFNQDIYITHFEAKAASPCNYYIELEVIPLDDAGAEYTTLKDMRQT